jgi:four helix bundle protein
MFVTLVKTGLGGFGDLQTCDLVIHDGSHILRTLRTLRHRSHKSRNDLGGTPSANRAGMNAQQLRDRSKRFATDIVLLCRALPTDWVTRTLGGQLLRSGTSVAANYRAACRGRSAKEFCAKIGLVAEESDESLLWLELLNVGSPGGRGKNHELLCHEADELTAIFSASYKTARANLKKQERDKKANVKSPNH